MAEQIVHFGFTGPIATLWANKMTDNNGQLTREEKAAFYQNIEVLFPKEVSQKDLFIELTDQQHMMLMLGNAGLGL
jgi:hypothetical protein